MSCKLEAEGIYMGYAFIVIATVMILTSLFLGTNLTWGFWLYIPGFAIISKQIKVKNCQKKVRLRLQSLLVSSPELELNQASKLLGVSPRDLRNFLLESIAKGDIIANLDLKTNMISKREIPEKTKPVYQDEKASLSAPHESFSILCPYCGYMNRQDDNFCSNCGNPLPKNTGIKY